MHDNKSGYATTIISTIHDQELSKTSVYAYDFVSDKDVCSPMLPLPACCSDDWGVTSVSRCSRDSCVATFSLVSVDPFDSVNSLGSVDSLVSVGLDDSVDAVEMLLRNNWWPAVSSDAENCSTYGTRTTRGFTWSLCVSQLLHPLGADLQNYSN